MVVLLDKRRVAKRLVRANPPPPAFRVRSGAPGHGYFIQPRIHRDFDPDRQTRGDCAVTRISPTLYPAPAGYTKAAPTHGTKARSCREQFGALTSVKGNQCAPTEGAPTPPLPLGHPQHTIPQAFERLNAPQMRRDRAQGWLDMDMVKILVLSVLCLSVLGIVDAKRNHDLNANWEQINED